MKILLFLLIAAFPLRIFAAEEFKQDGVWKPIAAVLGGARLPEAALKAITLSMSDGNYEVAVEGETEPDKGSVTLDTTTTPKRMTIKSVLGPNQGKTFLAIYEMKDANSMRVCYDLSGAAFPTEFKAPKGTQLYLVGYRKQPEAKPASAVTTAGNDWPCFRGPGRMGIAPPGNESIPLTWSDTENIIWKTPLPGRGASSPVIWKDNIYVTAFSGYGMEKGDPHVNIHKLVRHLLCVDRRTGVVRWNSEIPTKEVHEHGLSNYVHLHGYASSTPAADADGVYIYLGRRGVFAFDHAGKQRWKYEPADPKEHTWGSASSPVLFENLVIVHADPEIRAMVALDKKTGERVWKAPTGNGDSWSTPLLVQAGSRTELVFHHSDSYNAEDRIARVGAVDPRTGAPLWNCILLKSYLCPCPIAQDGVIYWLAYQGGAAMRAGGSGDVTASSVLWTTKHGTEICTPILHGGHLYWTGEENGMAYCLDAKTGADVYRERIEPKPGLIYASGVLAGDRIYYVSRENGTYVVPAKPEFRILAHNRIASDTGIFNGTPAISQGRIFLRSDRFLYCIGKK